MNQITIAGILVVAIVAIVLVMRRNRPRRIGGGAERTPAVAQRRAPAPGIPIDTALRHLSETDRTGIAREIASGRKISAIKLLREKTGMGLKEAKEFVEAFTADGKH